MKELIDKVTELAYRGAALEIANNQLKKDLEDKESEKKVLEEKIRRLKEKLNVSGQ